MKVFPKRITDLGHVVTGKTPPTKRAELFGGPYPFITPSDIDDETYYCLSTARTVSEEARARLPNQFIPRDAVMVTCIGATIGKTALAPVDSLTNQQINSIIVHDGTDARFVYYLMRSYGENLKQIGGGAATPIVSKRKFESIVVTVPDYSHQKAISGVLSAYDDLIEKNRRRIALLEDAARQLYREWFVRLRFPGREHTEVLDGIPEGWARTSFDAALLLQRGFDLPTHDRVTGTIAVYGSTGVCGFHDEARVAGPGIVTGRSGSLGRVNFAPRDFWPLNTALWVKEFRRVPPLFALHLMREMDLEQYNGGASVPTLDRKAVHRADIVLPDSGLMALFEEAVTPMFALITNLGDQNQKLRAARDLLLPRLMSGELVV